MHRQLLLLILPFLFIACAAGPAPRTVDHVDLNRYAGNWYEIARIPQVFELGCESVTATYAPLPDGTLLVFNRCHQFTATGPLRDIKGIARVVNSPDNTKLKVMFKWPFEGDYWIFRLNEDYTTAAAGSPDQKSLWILHRDPHMDASEYRTLIDSLRADGFPVSSLRKTSQ